MGANRRPGDKGIIAEMRKIKIIAIPIFFIVLGASFDCCQIEHSGEQVAAITASFAFNPASPLAGQPVQFTDTSTGNPTSWEWAFGDGATSTTKNPSHTYAAAGSYTVTLTVSAGSNSNSTSRTISVIPEAASYYIDTNNSKASDSNPGTEALPWKTITKANQALIPGDTVYIKAGTYTSYIAPNNSGTASNRITYRNYGSDAVTVQNAAYGIWCNGKSYIAVQGINFYNLDLFMYIENNANHNIVASCTFVHGRNVGWGGSKIYGSSSHNWVHHCRFSDYGYYTTDDIGCLLDIGNEEDAADISEYNLFEDCTMYQGGHHLLGVYGDYNVVRNNYFHNEDWSSNPHGNRCVTMHGYPNNSGHNLIEGNKIAYSGYPPPTDAWGAVGMGVSSSYNIIRLNSFYYNNLSGLALATSANYYQDASHNK